MNNAKNLAECPICHGHFVVDKNGKLAGHGWTGNDQGYGYRAIECEGGRKVAGEVVGTKVVVDAASKPAAINGGDVFIYTDGRKLKIDRKEGAQKYRAIIKGHDGNPRYMNISLNALRKLARA